MQKKIRHLLIAVCAVLISFLLQNTIAVAAKDTFVTPNFLIIIVCLFGLMCGKKEGIVLGLFCGLLADIFASDIIGLNAVLYMYVGYFSGFFNRLFYGDMVILPLATVFSGDFVYNFLYYIIRFLLRGKLDFSYYMAKIILPEMVITTFCALIVYRPLYQIYAKWLKKEQTVNLTFGTYINND